MPQKHAGWKIPDYLLLGFAISSIGGPLALAAIFLTSSASSGIHDIPATLLIGIILFSTVILIWMRYSDRIASSGGLYAFVKEASGERIARLQGYVWILSYFLYLPYTVTYIVFYILPSIFSVSNPDLYALEIVLPVIISAMIVVNRKLPFYFLFFLAIAQVAIVLILSAVIFGVVGLNPSSAVPNVSLGSLAKGGSGLALLFICADLPIFLGGEAQGKGKSIKNALAFSFAIVALLLLIFSIAISNLPENSDTFTVFGFQLAQQYGSNLFASILGIFAVLSIIGLIIAEFIGLSRLMSAMFKLSMPKILIYISAAFIFMDILSLANPDSFYNYLILPSLFALYASQLMVFLVYPMFISKFRRLSMLDIGITIVASLLFIFAIYAAITNYQGYFLQ